MGRFGHFCKNLAKRRQSLFPHPMEELEYTTVKEVPDRECLLYRQEGGVHKVVHTPKMFFIMLEKPNEHPTFKQDQPAL